MYRTSYIALDRMRRIHSPYFTNRQTDSRLKVRYSPDTVTNSCTLRARNYLLMMVSCNEDMDSECRSSTYIEVCFFVTAVGLFSCNQISAQKDAALWQVSRTKAVDST